MDINNDLYDKDDIRKLFKLVLIIWSLCAIYLSISHWDIVTSLHFSDNDDFMRFHQYREWLKNGNWYLEPIPQFSPNNQLIMHWSRLVDIPLALFASFFSLFFELPTAFAITNTLVPLLYLLVFLFLVSLVAYRLFGLETAKIAMIIPLISPLSMRFLPGALDHHNLQFILLTSFILFSPLINNKYEVKSAIFSALSMLLSLWIGLENIYSFVIILFLLTVFGFFKNISYLLFCNLVSLVSVILIPLLLIVNRPISEFFDAKYDILSFPFWLCFISAFIFCHLLTYFVNLSNVKKMAFYILLGFVLLLPVVISYPEIIKGGYSNYPKLLKELWLDNISEARSILYNIQADIRNVAYLLSVFMTMIFPLFVKFRNNERFYILYFSFLINFFLAFFWQVRMFSVALVCCIPLQAYVCFMLREKIKLVVLKVLFLFLSFPSVVLFAFLVFIEPFSDIKNELKNIEDVDHTSVISLLNDNKIENKNTLASTDLGAPIIVGTTNNIISAPYHRNIQGNLDTFNFFLFSNDLDAKVILDKYKIDYILLDKLFFYTLKQSGVENNLLNRLFNNKEIPNYLEYVDSNNSIKLYKYIGKCND